MSENKKVDRSRIETRSASGAVALAVITGASAGGANAAATYGINKLDRWW